MKTFLLVVCLLTTQTGLEWQGNGATRRMLYWSNPFPIYPATYIFRVFPRKKTPPSNAPNGYYTTFFWGNNGRFDWDTGNTGNTYYGAHPYPIPPPDGAGQWEISVFANDFVTGSEVGWDRWYTQAFRAWRETASLTHHEFYYDLPDTTKVIQADVNFSDWATRNPPAPAIVMGQAPDYMGNSWGGYPGWEEFFGIIRGIQIYSANLSLADIQAEITAPLSTTAGQASIWYLNLNPRPLDTRDKKGRGIAHDPAWDGGKAWEWTLKPDSTRATNGTIALLKNDTSTSWTGIEIVATGKLAIALTIGTKSMTRVCDVGTTTIQFSPAIALTRANNWKGEATVVPVASPVFIGSSGANGAAQPPGTVIF